MQIVAESQDKWKALREACRLAGALGSRTRSRDAIVDRIVDTWINSFLSLEVTPRGPAQRLDDYFRTLFAWLQNIYTGQFFAAQWKVFPEDWQVRGFVCAAMCVLQCVCCHVIGLAARHDAGKALVRIAAPDRRQVPDVRGDSTGASGN